MGAAGLIDIKRRIKSVENTRKITNAMGLVATSKLRKTKKELLVNEGFVNSLEPIVKALSASFSKDDENIYFDGNKSEDKLYIVMTSETGLCGGFNANIAAYLNGLIGNEKANSKVMVVGNRGIGYIKRIGLDTVEEYVDISDLPTVKECKVIFEKAFSMYISGSVSEINVVYTKFYSPVKQVPTSVKILPIERIEDKEHIYTIEPSVDIVLGDAINLYLKAKVRNLLLSSKCSEQSSRMTAMDGATSNANDLLSDLNLKYNRIRHGIITQEISEIVGGAAAQK